ncbi:MAG TPA: LptA/OstA family protein [Candidatus Dormibacteraeota bacterium]|nr:LptA/OstA family protein [Candidatus Dormibacteraeota bacterium]
MRAAALLVFLAAALVCPSQQVVQGTNPKFAEYYAPPHDTQIEWLVEGARAEPQDREGKRILIYEGKCQKYAETGLLELVVEAPQCLYDRLEHSLSSSGPMRVRTADAKFSLEGEGFAWMQTNSTLYISNRVHTIIHPEMLSASRTNLVQRSTNGGEGITVDSAKFTYSSDTGIGRYEEQVRVTGTNLMMTSSLLTFLLPKAEKQLERITSETNVVMEYELDGQQIHAVGEKADYSVPTAMARITGHPSWESGDRAGHGDELFIDRSNRVFQANGNAYLKMPASHFAESGLLGHTNAQTSGKSATNQFVEIESSNYTIRTNLAVFQNDVRMRQREEDKIGGTMSCALMTVAFAGTNELQTMLAETNVVINQEDKVFTSDTALYTATNGLLTLNGNPGWQAGLRRGKGDQIVGELRKDQILVEGNAYMRLPAGELGEALPGGAAPEQKAKATDTGFAEVFSQRYTLQPEKVDFEGGVRIIHPQMTWTSKNLIAKLASKEPKQASMLAEQQVAFVFNDPKNGSIHGTCERAVYDYSEDASLTNSLVRLTGSPILETTNGTFENKIILFDRTQNKLMARGNYRLHGFAPVDTNRLQMPKKLK